MIPRSVLTSFLAAIALATASLTFLPRADADTSAFTQSQFEAAQAAGRSVLVDVHATWCSTCRAQAAVIDRLVGEAKFKDLVVLRVDYDSEKDVMRGFGATQRSTLIAFRGVSETGRLVGDTSEAAIRALLETAYPGS